MAVANFPPIPYSDGLLEGDDKPISHSWYLWLFALVALLQASARVVTTKSYTNQSASIPATSLNVTVAGVYRVSWTLRPTQAATVSSSLIVTIGYTDAGQVLSVAGVALTANLVTTPQSGTFLLRTDGASPVTAAIAYGSVGGTPLVFKADVTCEQVA
jgi:hypothetical protein